MKEQKTYEEVFASLEKLVTAIEDPKRDLSAVAADVRKALELIAWCKEYLRGDREKMEELLKEDKQ